jgi:hypothetical protein
MSFLKSAFAWDYAVCFRLNHPKPARAEPKSQAAEGIGTADTCPYEI